MLALPEYCALQHPSNCSLCSSLLTIAKMVLENGFVLLSETYRSAFPHVTYHSSSAKKRVLQMPLVSIRVGQPESGVS